MIDCHTHLEQSQFDSDRDSVVENCRKVLNAVVTSCAHPKDFSLTMELVKKYRGFVFASAGLHPEYIKELNGSDVENYLELVKTERNNIVSVGEVGLDFFYIHEQDWREKQKELLVQLIGFSKEIKKPLTIHSRDAHEDVVKILEQEDAKEVHLHLFGDNKLVKMVSDNGWYVSIGPGVIGSKKLFQVTRDMPLGKIMLETDAPWNHPKVFTEHIKLRNDPTNVKAVAEKIAEIKRTVLEEVDRTTTENAIRFFGLADI